MVKLRIFLLVGLSLVSFLALSQKRYKKSLNQTYGNQHKPARFKNNKKMAVICPTAEYSEYPFQGIGIKLGDPFVLTYKLYATEWLAFSIDGGLAASGLYKSRYTELFNSYPGTDTLSYVNHTVDKDVHFSAKVSFYNSAPKVLKGVDYYLSLGWQFRYVDLLYGYVDEISPGNSLFGTRTEQADYHGPEIGLGVEYSYFDMPITAFIEATWMYDIVNLPNAGKFQGGIGIRYMF
ncbi:MAG: hypothetical protein DRI71_05045 [Bacteroidetes bacterium]|nr:MAG: hypothetical protein DRI71_05045 [Bacteroidota bacterium]